MTAVTEPTVQPSRLVGQGLPRREDAAFLTGRARFTADITLPGQLHVVFVRSPHAHARLVSVDVTAAADAPGVVTVLTGADLAEVRTLPPNWLFPGGRAPLQPPLAREVVRHVGEPVALLVATDPYLAADAAPLVDVTYQPLPHVTDAWRAHQPDAVQLHDDIPGNVSFERRIAQGDCAAAEAAADLVLTTRLVNQRLVPSPIEPRAVVADPDPTTDALTLWTATQAPHLIKWLLAQASGLPEHRLRVIAPAVGGGFGAKLALYREEVALAVTARRLGRPLKWVETRSENVVAMTHGRDHVQDVTVAATADGRLQSLRAEVWANLGAYCSSMGHGVPGTNFSLMFGGSYDIPNAELVVRGMLTNTAPVDTYRGAGRPEATFLVERAVQLVADRLGLEAVEVRRRNYLTGLPRRNAIGAMVYDSGDYPANQARMEQLLDLPAQRARQAALRAEGRHLGIGTASYVEFTGDGVSAIHDLVGFRRGGFESAVVRVHPTGTVTLLSGASAHGQGHDTTYAQIVADRLGVDLDDVTVVQSDTDKVPYGNGTYNSRSMPVGASAVHLSLERVVDKATRIAAAMLEAAPEDVELQDGAFGVVGDPERRLTWAEVATKAHLGALPDGIEPGLEALAMYEPTGFPSSFGSHAVVVEVDIDTGQVRLDRVVAVDDCGVVINPLIATGQIHGGLAQGIGQALHEGIDYDADGQPTVGSLANYTLPRAEHFPRFELDHTQTPSPLNPLGVKGVGESGTIGSTPAVVAAVLDALAPLGVTDVPMPMTPVRIWRAIQAARGGEAAR